MTNHRYHHVVRLLMIVALGLGCAVSHETVGAAAGKPFLAPVKIDFTPPPAAAKAGDVIDTDIRLQALENLDRLDVSVAPFFGLQVTSQPTEATFTSVSKGDSRSLHVTVRLVERAGSLAVDVDTVRADNKENAGGAITIEYGSGR